MAVEITRSLKEINAEVVKLDGNIKSVTNQNKQLDKSLKFDPSSTALLAQKTQNLRDQIALATQKVNALKTAQVQLKAQMDIGNATAEEYQKISLEVAKAEAQVKSFTAQLKLTNNQKLTGLQNSLRGVSTAAKVALVGVAALGYKYTETGDEISKAAARYKVSADTYQRNAFVFDRATGNADGYTIALENVQKQMSAVAKGSSKAITAFQAVGISLDEIAGKSTSEVLDLVIRKLSAIADEDERLTLANALLTTAGYEVAQVSELTAEELAALNEEVEKNGLLTDEQAEKAAALKDKFEDLTATLQYGLMELGEALLPLLESLIEIFSSLAPVISLVASIFKAIPKPMQMIVAILLILLTVLPKLISIFKAVNSVMMLVGSNPMAAKIMLICTAVSMLIILLVNLANLIGGIFGKHYELDVDTSALGTDLANVTANVTGSASGSSASTNNTTNYYDYSTTNVEAHTDADIDDIASQLSTKIKVGGR